MNQIPGKMIRNTMKIYKNSSKVSSFEESCTIINYIYKYINLYIYIYNTKKKKSK